MKIDVSSIIKLEGSYIEVELEESLDLLKEKIDDFQFEPNVKFKGLITNVGSILRLSGIAECSCLTICNKCLKEFTETVEVKLKDIYFQKELEEDSDNYIFTGYRVDIDKAIFDNLILNLPMRPICSEDCKGLCPICGQDRNKSSCECESFDGDERLSILRNFFDK